MSANRTWPPPPPLGELADLPITAPPILTDALHYRGDDQHVAVYLGRRGAVWLNDGIITDAGDLLAWHRFSTHRLTEPLAGYNLGDRGADATLWLLIDRTTDRLRIGHPTDVTEILDAQPHTRDPVTGRFFAAPASTGNLPPDVRAARTPTGPGWLGQATRAADLLDSITRSLDRALAGDIADRAAALSDTVANQLRTTRPFSDPADAAGRVAPTHGWSVETESAGPGHAASPTETGLG